MHFFLFYLFIFLWSMRAVWLLTSFSSPWTWRRYFSSGGPGCGWSAGWSRSRCRRHQHRGAGRHTTSAPMRRSLCASRCPAADPAGQTAQIHLHLIFGLFSLEWSRAVKIDFIHVCTQFGWNLTQNYKQTRTNAVKSGQCYNETKILKHVRFPAIVILNPPTL